MLEDDGGEPLANADDQDADLAAEVNRDPFLFSRPDSGKTPDLGRYMLTFEKRDAVEQLCAGLRLRFRRDGAA